MGLFLSMKISRPLALNLKLCHLTILLISIGNEFSWEKKVLISSKYQGSTPRERRGEYRDKRDHTDCKYKKEPGDGSSKIFLSMTTVKNINDKLSLCVLHQ